MKLLFDENLSPRLVDLLAEAFHGTAHVHGLGLGASDDLSVWNHAKANGLALVTKDADFNELSAVHGALPHVAWVRTVGCVRLQA